jgi:hypothetical protein
MRNPDARRDRLRAAGPWVLDGLLAVAAAALGLSLLVGVLPFDPGSPLAWAAYLLVLAHTLPLAVRRRWPLGVLVWALATGAAFAAVGPSLVALSFTILIYVYTAAAHCPRRVSLDGWPPPRPCSWWPGWPGRGRSAPTPAPCWSTA